jgi:hypothetical protein
MRWPGIGGESHLTTESLATTYERAGSQRRPLSVLQPLMRGPGIGGEFHPNECHTTISEGGIGRESAASSTTNGDHTAISEGGIGRESAASSTLT